MKTTRRVTLSRRARVQKEMPAIIYIHPSVRFIKKLVANLEPGLQSSILKRLEANRRSEIILWQSPKTCGYHPSGKKFASVQFRAMGGLLHGASVIPVTSFLQRNLRAREEEPHVGNSTNKWTKCSKPERSVV